MARSTQKPSNKVESSKIYWGVTEEAAVALYLELKDGDQPRADRIFEIEIYPKLKMLVENIMFRYKLAIADVDVSEQIDDCISFVAFKFQKFVPSMNKKSYSYYGTIAKNYMIMKKMKAQSATNMRQLDDFNMDEIDALYSVDIDSNRGDTQNMFLFSSISTELKSHLQNNPCLYHPNVYIVGECVVFILENSSMLNIRTKNSFYFLCKEMTELKTKDITKALITLKDIYVKIRTQMNS